jgi:hypothetical protein
MRRVRNTTALLHYGTTALRRYGATALRHYGATALRHYGATALRRYGTTSHPPKHHGTTFRAALHSKPLRNRKRFEPAPDTLTAMLEEALVAHGARASRPCPRSEDSQGRQLLHRVRWDLRHDGGRTRHRPQPKPQPARDACQRYEEKLRVLHSQETQGFRQGRMGGRASDPS